VKRTARIIRVTPDYLEAVIEKPLACAGCTGSCHRNIVHWLSGRNQDRLIIYRQASGKKAASAALSQGQIVDAQQFFPENPSVGQRFGVEFDESSLLRSAFWLYAMPLMLMLAGLAIGYFLFRSLGYSADLGGLLGLLCGLLASRWFIAHSTSQPVSPIRFY
jgi:positive regulator of sigma E activity